MTDKDLARQIWRHRQQVHRGRGRGRGAATSGGRPSREELQLEANADRWLAVIGAYNSSCSIVASAGSCRYSSDGEEGTQQRSKGADLAALLEEHFADTAHTVRRVKCVCRVSTAGAGAMHVPHTAAVQARRACTPRASACQGD